MTKEELIALAKELASLEDLSGRGRDYETVKREYEKLKNKDTDSLYDENALKELEGYYDALTAKASAVYAANYEAKKAIIAKAQLLIDREDIMKAYSEYNALFEEYKQAGRCGGDKDEECWAEWKAIRNKLNDKRHAYFAELTVRNAAKQQQKREIIAKAKEVLAMENIKEASAKMDELMNEWKAVGFSGKENDDALWGEFSAARKEFAAKKKAHYETLMKTYADRVAKKEALIEETRRFCTGSNFERGDINQIKEFRAQWKEIGFAGKDKDEALYQEFNGIIQNYFDEKKNSAF